MEHSPHTTTRSTRPLRLLGWGALAGLLSSIAGLLVAPRLADGGIELDLTRLTMVAPAAVYVLWWVIGPGIAADRERVPEEGEPDPALLERIFGRTSEPQTYASVRPRSGAQDASSFAGQVRRRTGAAEPAAELRPSFRKH